MEKQAHQTELCTLAASHYWLDFPCLQPNKCFTDVGRIARESSLPCFLLSPPHLKLGLAQSGFTDTYIEWIRGLVPTFPITGHTTPADQSINPSLCLLLSPQYSSTEPHQNWRNTKPHINAKLDLHSYITTEMPPSVSDGCRKDYSSLYYP